MKRVIWVLGTAALVFTVVLAVDTGWSGLLGGVKGVAYSDLVPLGEALEEVERNYVDDVDVKKVVHGAMSGLVESLGDAHSSFFEPEEYKRMHENTQGEFGGLGILIGMRDGFLTVVRPIAGKVADREGVEEGDRIVAIEGEITGGISMEMAVQRLQHGMDLAVVRELLGITLPEAVNKLRGRVGSKVTITLLREGREEPWDVTLTREKIELESVAKVEMVEEGIGYIRITDFASDTARALGKGVKRLEREGMDSLILDLRNNPGGLLESAVNVSDIFLPAGRLIVYAQGRGGKQMFSRSSTDRFPYRQYPLIVLVNEASASGSEIVAGAIEDWERGLLLGAKTFGKGSVQNIIKLSDGSALRLTTARYYTPKGRMIDKKGIEPDIVVASELPRWEGKRAREERKDVPEEPGDKEEDDKKAEEDGKEEQDGKAEEGEEEEPFKDVQLERAIQLLKAFESFNEVLLGSKERAAAG